MKCLKNLLTITLCCIIFINNPNIVYANIDYTTERAESTDDISAESTDDMNTESTDDMSTDDMDVRIYKVPVISNECTGPTVTFYRYNEKFFHHIP